MGLLAISLSLLVLIVAFVRAASRFDSKLAAFEGRMGSLLWSFSSENGQKLAEVEKLDAPPIYDGLIASAKRLYISLQNGRVVCFAAKDAAAP